MSGEVRDGIATSNQAVIRNGRRATMVSVGLPVYNGERFLAEALDSLLAQTFEDFELIISDNASTDRTQEICVEYARRDDRIRYVRQERNLGQTRNWNLVVSEARFPFFKWASANDNCDPAFLQKCLDALLSDDRIVLAYGRTRLIDDDGTSLGPYDQDLDAVDERPSKRFIRVLAEWGLNNAQVGVIRLDTLRRTRQVRPVPAGDILLMAELALLGRFVLLPDVLLHRRMGRESATRFLTRPELLRVIDPETASHPQYVAWQSHGDCGRSVLRAPIGFREKVNALLFVAKMVRWDRARMWSEATEYFTRGRFRTSE